MLRVASARRSRAALCAKCGVSSKVTSVEDLSADELTRILAYAGFVLVGFELLKTMIVNPIKSFYAHTDFSGGTTFQTYEKDVPDSR